MDKNKTIREMFDEKINKDRIKENILTKQERKNNYKMKRVLNLGIITVCLVCTIYLVMSTNKDLSLENNNVKGSSGIYINELQGANLTSHDSDIKTVNNVCIPYFEIIDEAKIPTDFDNVIEAAIYIKNENTNEYDILNNYEFLYYNTSNNRSIKISFSENHEPIRDYFIEKEGTASTIKGTNLIIYKSNNCYMTNFKYNNYYFDIETQDITETEFTELLNSIIK